MDVTTTVTQTITNWVQIWGEGSVGSTTFYLDHNIKSGTTPTVVVMGVMPSEDPEVTVLAINKVKVSVAVAEESPKTAIVHLTYTYEETPRTVTLNRSDAQPVTLDEMKAAFNITTSAIVNYTNVEVADANHVSDWGSLMQMNTTSGFKYKGNELSKFFYSDNTDLCKYGTKWKFPYNMQVSPLGMMPRKFKVEWDRLYVQDTATTESYLTPTIDANGTKAQLIDYYSRINFNDRDTLCILVREKITINGPYGSSWEEDGIVLWAANVDSAGNYTKRYVRGAAKGTEDYELNRFFPAVYTTSEYAPFARLTTSSLVSPARIKRLSSSTETHSINFLPRSVNIILSGGGAGGNSLISSDAASGYGGGGGAIGIFQVELKDNTFINIRIGRGGYGKNGEPSPTSPEWAGNAGCTSKIFTLTELYPNGYVIANGTYYQGGQYVSATSDWTTSSGIHLVGYLRGGNPRSTTDKTETEASKNKTKDANGNDCTDLSVNLGGNNYAHLITPNALLDGQYTWSHAGDGGNSIGLGGVGANSKYPYDHSFRMCGQLGSGGAGQRSIGLSGEVGGHGGLIILY